MSQKTISKICRYATSHGYKYLSLEQKADSIVCRYDNNHYLRLPRITEEHIISLFRSLLESEENDYVYNKNFKIMDGKQVIKGSATISPAKYGDKININLNTTLPNLKQFSRLGLNKVQKTQLTTALEKKNGLIIISAPEQHGLTSTYYSLLDLLNHDRSVYSLEDFPEYSLNGVNTIRLQEYGGLKMSLDLLRRLDTDIIACDCKLKPADLKLLWQNADSRLIIAAMYSKSSADVLRSLKSAGISSAAIAQRLLVISHQRLFKQQCVQCLEVEAESEELKKQIVKKWPITKKYWPQRSYVNRGCKKCQSSQNLDKVRIFEIMNFDKNGELKTEYNPLILEALRKVELGIINLEEIADWAQSNK